MREEVDLDASMDALGEGETQNEDTSLCNAESFIVLVPVAVLSSGESSELQMMSQMLLVVVVSPCWAGDCCLDVPEASAVEGEVAAHLHWGSSPSSTSSSGLLTGV